MPDRWQSCPEPGDLVSIAENPEGEQAPYGAGLIIQKSQIPYDSKLIGIVTENSAITMGGGDASTSRPVVLGGRVPVKVSLENGPIEIGDPLTSANQPGLAMKATEPGRVIGMALEPFNSTSTEEVGKIMVFVNPHWSIGQLSENGSLAGTEESTETGSLSKSFIQKVKHALASLGLFIENGIAKVKELVAEKITSKISRTEKLEMVDQITGEIYCTWIENGEWQKVRGECNTIGTSGGNNGNGGGSNNGTEEPPAACGANNLNLCSAQADCQANAGYWYDEACHSQPQTPTCAPNWQPSDWEPTANPDTLQCGETVIQKRTCNDLNNCGVEDGKPADETQEVKGAFCEQGTCDLEKGGCQLPSVEQ